MKKQEKTSKSAKAQKNHPKTGRGGLSRLWDNMDHLWPQLVSVNPHLEVLQDPRSKLFAAARAGKDKDTGLYKTDAIDDEVDKLGHPEKRMKEDGTYYERRSNPITECFGPEHGGRTWLYSCVVGASHIVGVLFKGDCDIERVNLNRESQSVDVTPCSRDFSCASYIDHAVIQVIYIIWLIWL
ncbi:uncharacterized protein LOC143635911 [Bidens hawaiensis]|uniref:uncharacterized protein LOC143635911 n=1 Tax=Bidens hawaiensis TaxID=980011 RepID=UPI00404A46CD